MKKIFFTLLIFFVFTVSLYSKATKTFRGQYLVKVEEDIDGVKQTDVLNYSDGHLVFSSHYTSDSDVPDSVEYYIRSYDSGPLIGIRRMNRTDMSGSGYLYQEDVLYMNAAPNLVVDSSFDVDSNGSVTFEKDGVKSVYNPDGTLMYEESDEGRKDYLYDSDGNVSSCTLTKDDTQTVYEYRNSLLYKETKIQNNIKIQETEFVQSGKVKRIFDKGKLSAVIKYEQDNIKIKNIEYL